MGNVHSLNAVIAGSINSISFKGAFGNIRAFTINDTPTDIGWVIN